MADRHTIVICVEAGKVREVQFCDCAPAVTVEVRTYTKSQRAASKARPAWFMPGGDTQPSEFKRDERGVYKTSYYEADAEGE